MEDVDRYWSDSLEVRTSRRLVEEPGILKETEDRKNGNE